MKLSYLTRHTTILVITLACIATSGCSDRTTSKVKDTLGMTAKAPNEHSIVSYQPLTIPPTLNSNDLNMIYGNSKEAKGNHPQNKAKTNQAITNKATANKASPEVNQTRIQNKTPISQPQAQVAATKTITNETKAVVGETKVIATASQTSNKTEATKSKIEATTPADGNKTIAGETKATNDQANKVSIK